MRRLRNCTVALLLGLCVPLLIWVGAGTVLYQSRKQIKFSKRALHDLVCAIDTDCPPGYVCLNGRCVPATQ